MRRELEVMRVLRVPPLGKLVVEVNDARFQALSEIPDEKARRVLLAAIGELIDFAGGYKNLVRAGVAPALTGMLPPLEEPPLEQRQAEFLARLEAERDTVGGSLGGIQPGPDIPAEILPESIQQEMSVAEQIDLILQKHISGDSEMAGRSIRLLQDQTGGISIEVDGKMYQQPGDIPDAQIQLLIKRAVKEWDAA